MNVKIIVTIALEYSNVGDIGKLKEAVQNESISWVSSGAFGKDLRCDDSAALMGVSIDADPLSDLQTTPGIPKQKEELPTQEFFYPVDKYVEMVKEMDAFVPQPKPEDAHDKNVLYVLEVMMAQKAPLWAIKNFLKFVD